MSSKALTPHRTRQAEWPFMDGCYRQKSPSQAGLESTGHGRERGQSQDPTQPTECPALGRRLRWLGWLVAIKVLQLLTQDVEPFSDLAVFFFLLVSSGARPIVSSEFRTWEAHFIPNSPSFFLLLFPSLVARQKSRRLEQDPCSVYRLASLRFFVPEGSRVSKFPSIAIPVLSPSHVT